MRGAATAAPPPRQASFEETARRELPLLYRLARRLTLDPTEAEDLVGQTLLNASAAWGRFDGGYPRSWLVRIMRNLYLQSERKRGAAPLVVGLHGEIAGQEPWEAIDWGLLGPLLLAQLDSLPEEYRLAVALCDVEEMAYDESAAALGISLGTLKSRLHRGRRLLRERMGEWMGEHEG